MSVSIHQDRPRRAVGNDAHYERQNQLDVALQEIGKIERTLFMLDWLDWLENPELRRRCRADLNKSEQRREFIIRSSPDGLYQRYYPQYLENLLDIVAEDVAARFWSDRFRSYHSIPAFGGECFNNHAKRCKPVLSVLPPIM